MSPQLSIITPIYNRAGFITRCYHNLLQQSFTDWEWIIVDDGSTDNLGERIRGICDERIRFISYRVNKGRGFARTKALHASKGNWIVIWDSDDIHYPDRLERINEAREQGYDYCCSYVVSVDKGFLIQSIQGYSPVLSGFPKSFVHTSMACRLDVAKEIGYQPDIQTGEDFSMLMTLPAKFKGWYFKDVLSIQQETEVNLDKAIECNLGHFEQINELFRKKVISGYKGYFVVKFKYILKLFLLYSLRICPPVYRKLSYLRSSGEIESEWELSRIRLDFIEKLKVS